MKPYTLSSVISGKLSLSSKSVEFTEVYAYCISYLTNGVTAFKFQRQVREYLPKGLSAKVFRLHLLKNKYNYFTLKLFVLNLSKIKLNDYPTAEELARSFGVHSKDFKVIHELWATSPRFRKRIRTWVKELPKGCDLTPKGIETEFSNEIYPVVFKKIKGVAYSKLRFIARSSNLDLTDLQSELALKCIQSYYKIVPTNQGQAYVINYLKRAITNHSTNMIMTATTKKHGRLICTGVDSNNDRVFSLRTVAENQMTVTTNLNGDTTESSIQDQDYCSSDPTLALENEICVTTILDKYKAKAKKHRLLLLLMGKFDEQFTEWLHGRKLCLPREDNCSLQDRLDQNEFRKLISQFLHIDDAKVNVFLFKLGQSISNPPSLGRSNESNTRNLSARKATVSSSTRRSTSSEKTSCSARNFNLSGIQNVR